MKPAHALLPLVLLVFAMLSMTPRGVSADTQTEDGIYHRAEDVQPLLPGMKAPEFTLRDAAGRPLHFNPGDLDRPVVLTFFRGGWCPYCNLHLAELRHAEDELEEMGYDLWFISMDRPEKLYASLEDPDIGYTVYSDASLDATRAFGIGFRVDEDTVARYREYGIDLEDASGEQHHVLPAPSTFLIGADGIIRFQYTNPNYQVRLHPDVLLAAAKAHQQNQDDRLQRAYRERKAGE